jgi:hypothetical protein
MTKSWRTLNCSSPQNHGRPILKTNWDLRKWAFGGSRLVPSLLRLFLQFFHHRSRTRTESPRSLLLLRPVVWFEQQNCAGVPRSSATDGHNMVIRFDSIRFVLCLAIKQRALDGVCFIVFVFLDRTQSATAVLVSSEESNRIESNRDGKMHACARYNTTIARGRAFLSILFGIDVIISGFLDTEQPEPNE